MPGSMDTATDPTSKRGSEYGTFSSHRGLGPVLQVEVERREDLQAALLEQGALVDVLRGGVVDWFLMIQVT